MAELSVQIGADIKDLLSKLDLTEKQLKKLETISKTSGKAIASTGTTAATGINALQKSSANALPALTSVSQVIQDAPYGIRGVANNIQQLTSQFGYLSKSAGGSGAALKAMAGSFLGPAGILFAVSAVTSLLVSYDSELKDTRTGAEKAADANKKLYESLDSYNDALSATRKAGLEADKIASKQIIGLAQLRTQIENVNGSQEIRLDGIKKLREEFGPYFKDVTNESLLNGTASTSYDVLTNSILKRAKATAATNILVKNAEKEFDVSEKLKDLNDQITTSKTAQAKAEATAITAISKNLAGQEAAQASANAKSKETNALLAEQKTLTEELSKLGKSNLELNAIVVANEIVVPPKLEDGNGKGRIKIKSAVELELPQDLDKNTQKFTKGAFEVIKKNFGLQNSKLGVDLIDVSAANANVQAFVDTYKAPIEELQQYFVQASDTAYVFADGVGSAMNALGNQIASTFQTGSAVLDAFVGSILNSLSQIGASLLQNLLLEKVIGTAKKVVDQGKANSNAIVIATNAAAALGPFGVAALPGIIASQLAVVNGAFAGIQAFAKGGFSGDNNMAYLNRNELILRPQEQAALWNGLRGKNLGSVSGAVGGDYTTTTKQVIEGDKLILVTERAQRRKDRVN
jgi:hypothetical protein